MQKTKMSVTGVPERKGRMRQKQLSIKVITGNIPILMKETKSRFKYYNAKRTNTIIITPKQSILKLMVGKDKKCLKNG